MEKDVFTEDELDDFIKDVGIQSKVEELKNAGKFNLRKCKYIAAAAFIREAFFNNYVGLGQRLQRELSFALKNGYVRAWHGAVRHVPQLLYMDFGTNGALRGADRELFSLMFSGLKNDAGNSTIQTLESDITQRSFLEVSYYIKKWNLKSRLWNQVHDSGDYFIYCGDGPDDPDNEERLVEALIYKLDTWDREPFYGIPMDIDAEIADVSTDELVKAGNWYHSGTEVHFKDLDLDTELKRWNDLHGTDYEFKKLDDLTWEL